MQALVLGADVMTLLPASDVLKGILALPFFSLIYENMISLFVPIPVRMRGEKLTGIGGCASGRRVIVTRGCVAFPAEIFPADIPLPP